MIFVQQILIIACFYYDYSHNFVLHSTANPTKNSEFNIDIKLTGDESFSSKKTLLQYAKPESVKDLQHNVFDKMLSDEMLSIKNSFIEKDLTFTQTLQPLIKVNVATPTLEVQQKWSVLLSGINKYSTYLFNDNTTDQSRFYISNTTGKETTYKLPEINDLYDPKMSKNKKNLELRSLQDSKSRIRLNLNNTGKLCSCMKTNPSTTCTQQCSATTKKICTHSSTLLFNQHGCTRTATTIQFPPKIEYYPAYYLPYQTDYIVGLTSESYYHPDVISNSKVPSKHKHRKTTKRPFYENEYDEDNLDSDSSSYSYEVIDKLKNERIHNNHKSENSLVSFSESNDSNLEKEENGIDTYNNVQCDKFINKEQIKGDTSLVVDDKNNLINNLISDLENNHSDIVVKDCYCSSSATKDTVLRLRFTKIHELINLLLHNFLLYFLVLVTLNC